MLDFDVQRCTRRCAVLDRDLAPGEVFFSVLVADGARVLRRDISQEAWQEPPADAIGWWRSRMSETTAVKTGWAPSEVMLHYFESLAGDPEKLDVRHVLALLLIRRRILRLDDTVRDESGRETLVLYCSRNENVYQVPVVLPAEERARDIQLEIEQLLQTPE